MWGDPRGDCQTKTSCLPQLHGARLSRADRQCPLQIMSPLVVWRQRSNWKTQNTWFLWIVLVVSEFYFLCFWFTELFVSHLKWAKKKREDRVTERDTEDFEIHANITLSIYRWIISNLYRWGGYWTHSTPAGSSKRFSSRFYNNKSTCAEHNTHDCFVFGSKLIAINLQIDQLPFFREGQAHIQRFNTSQRHRGLVSFQVVQVLHTKLKTKKQMFRNRSNTKCWHSHLERINVSQSLQTLNWK